jgi:hypothetical protein
MWFYFDKRGKRMAGNGHTAIQEGNGNRTTQRGHGHCSTVDGNFSSVVQDGSQHKSSIFGNDNLTAQNVRNNNSNTRADEVETVQHGKDNRATADWNGTKIHQAGNGWEFSPNNTNIPPPPQISEAFAHGWQEFRELVRSLFGI